MLTEELIHIELERLIGSGNFYNSIDSKDIEKIKNITRINENLLPAFSIDEYVRRQYAYAADNVLRSIENLEVLTSDKNVSTRKGQILRPDLVCINPESQQIVIFEIKKSTQTERQALTELLAYEHEIKNLFPFLSNYDLNFVLVSTEWSVLLEHAAGSAISWSNKNLLCLKVNVNQSEFSFGIQVLKSWSITGTVFFPPNSVESFTVSFDASPSMSESEIAYRVDLLLGFFAREADRIGLHGFAIATTDLSLYSERSYQIIFCAVNPLAFFDSMLSSGRVHVRDGHLVEKIEKYKQNHGLMSRMASLDDLINEIVSPRLSMFENVEFGGDTTWNVTRHQLKDRGLPTFIEFWGLPADYARDQINNPAVQNARPELFALGMTDWRDPTTGLWLIRNLFEPTFYADGFIRPSDTFRLGIALGHDIYLRHVAKNSSNRPKNIDAVMFWNFSTLECYLNEILILARTSNIISPPKSPIKFSRNVDNDIDNNPLIEWIVSEILQEDEFHLKLFDLAVNLSHVVTAEDLQPSNFIGVRTDEEWLENLRLTLTFIIKHSIKTQSNNESEKFNYIEKLSVAYEIPSEKFKDENLDISHMDINQLSRVIKDTFILADLTLPAVTHLYEELPSMHVDWDNLKRGIDEMYERGAAYVAIHISANGAIGTACYDNVEYAKLFKPLSNTELEVFVMDASRGVEIFRIETWDNVRAGRLIKMPVP